MIDKIINTKKMENADVVLLGAPYEASVSFMKGTSTAPKKIIECLDNYLEFFDINLLCEPCRKIKTAYKELHKIKKLKSKEAISVIKNEYKKIISKNKFGIILGGEHSVSLGALQAISEKEDPKKITILQIDAHQDLRNDNSDYEKEKNNLAHSCVMRRAHELGFNLVQVGIRTFSKYEYEYWQKNKKDITVFEWNKKQISIETILKSIKTKKIYLTIDVDGFDPAYMPGTGTPVQGGLRWYYGLDLIEKAINKKELVGADIVEVSPQKGTSLTEFGAALLCYKIMTYKFKQKFLS